MFFLQNCEKLDIKHSIENYMLLSFAGLSKVTSENLLTQFYIRFNNSKDAFTPQTHV